MIKLRNGTKYLRMNQVKLVKDSLSKILLRQFLNTFTQCAVQIGKILMRIN